MRHHDKKIGKIVDELVTYLLRKNCRNIKISIECSSDNDKIVFTFCDATDALLNLLKETLTQDRNEQLEEYGWELLGENDCSGELNLIGMLIDKCEFKSIGKYTQITMYRQN